MIKLSRCCAATVEAIHEDEGQSYWLCTSCHNQCGVTDEYQKLNHMINHSTDTTMRYDKGLPRKRRMRAKENMDIKPVTKLTDGRLVCWINEKLYYVSLETGWCQRV